MRFFSVTRDIALTTAFAHRRLKAPPPAREIAVADIVVAVHGEAAHVQKALDIEAAIAAGDPPPAGDDLPETTPDLKFYSEAQLRGWPLFPQRLGRTAFAQAGDATPSVVADAAPLAAQLAALRARRPERRHFRLALVNGFGGNLGDTMLGAAAWRAALPVLRAGLPSVAADVLLGPSCSPAATGLIAHEDAIGDVLYTGPTLQQLARYDAVFDFSGLIKLPRFTEGAHVDWAIWWLGLDPGAVPSEDKRCRLHLPAAARDWARDRLASIAGPKIAFVWQASVALRAMPDAIARRFAEALLAAAPAITLIADRPLRLEHARLVDLGESVDTPERLMALVAEADGLITVDSLAQHVADAADVPTVLLAASLPPQRFAYYPNMMVLTPPGAEDLPGWSLTKLASDAAFEPMRAGYERAWAGVSAAHCWALLQERMSARTRRPSSASGLVTSAARDLAARPPAARASFPYDRHLPADAAIDAELARIAALVLAPGQTALVACGDTHGLALALARRVAPGGALHVLEPRRLRAQRLCADVAAAGLDTLHLHPVLAGPTSTMLDLPDFDPAGESDQAEMGNVSTPARIAGTTLDALLLDALQLPACAVLVLRPPQDPVGALQGAAEVLRRLRPLVLVGSLSGGRVGALAACLTPLGYGCAMAWAKTGGGALALVVGTPHEAKIELSGFERVEAAPPEAPIQADEKA